MPKRSRRAQLALSQRQNGNRFFNSGLIEDFFEQAVDPDYRPSDGDGDDRNDSDEETSSKSVAFTLAEHIDMHGDSNELDSDEATDWEDQMAFSDVIKGQESFKVKRARLRAMPTYTGVGRSSVAEREKKLREASKGCAKLNSYFSKSRPERVDSPVCNNARISVSKGPQTTAIPQNPHVETRDQTMSLIPQNGMQSPAEPEALATPASNDQSSRSAEEPAGDLHHGEVDEDIPVAEMLGFDDEMEVQARLPVGRVIAKLIKDAKKHKSFASLFKLEAVKNYLELREKYAQNPRVKDPHTRASLKVATAVGRGPYFAKKIRHLTVYIANFQTLPPTSSGKHHAHPSLLNNECVSQSVRRYLTLTAAGEITPQALQKQVNNVIIPALGLDLAGKSISEGCARRWLHKLGYAVTEVRKGVYVDGHEREDVVSYRKEFLAKVAANDHLRYHFEDKTLEPIKPTLGPGEQLHVPVFQDESIFRSNDLRRRVWAANGRLPLRKKGQGRSVHVSDFVVEYTGRLQLSEAEIEHQNQLPESERVIENAREIIYPGKNADGFWNAKRLCEQMKRVIPLFEKLYPGAVGEFFFDCSTAHEAFAEDALNANEMNVNPGGQQRVMHDTFIPLDNPHPELRGRHQSMVFPIDLPPDDPNYEHRGKPKGMKQILIERGLWDELTRLNGNKPIHGDCQECKLSKKERERREKEAAEEMAGLDEPEETNEDLYHFPDRATCCMRKVLAYQADFRSEKPYLQQIIEEAGHKCYFFPKFHCELNAIEMYWGWTKIRYRCLSDGTFKSAKALVPELLDECPINTIRAFFRKSWRYMDAYSKGLSARQAEFAVRKYRSHRRVGALVMMSVDCLLN